MIVMRQIQLATKIDKDIKKAVEVICEEHGWKMNRFIEEALLDRLEELEDIADLRSLRREPTKSLSEVLKTLKARGKL